MAAGMHPAIPGPDGSHGRRAWTAGANGSGWPAFAARRAAKARSSPTFSPISLKNLPSAGGSGCWPRAQPAAADRRAARSRAIAHWLHKGGVVLHFAGVDSISAAETLAGLIVAIPRAERAALGEDEVYIGDLIGCTLVDVAGAEPVVVGEIEDVDRTAGPVALLVVRGASAARFWSLCEELSAQDRPRGRSAWRWRCPRGWWI